MKILMVCTGNICRSPTAEGVLRHRLRQAGLDTQVRVDSAGTHDYHIGDPPDPRSIRAARAEGIDISSLRARQLSIKDFEHFDLMLAMDKGHHAIMQRLCPAPLQARVKLYLDFAPQQPLREMPDPYYGDLVGFNQVLQLCHAATDGLLASIRQQLHITER